MSFSNAVTAVTNEVFTEITENKSEKFASSTLNEEDLNVFIKEEQDKKKTAIKDSYKKGEIALCSDYYISGSVSINIDQDYVVYNAGDPILMKGVIKNNNKYPVIGMDIKARLVKNIISSNEQDKKSEVIILDEFNIAENITLSADKELKVSYTYTLPLNASSGYYQVFFYAVEQDRFNMSGLWFTNNVVGSKISFDVKGSISDSIYLDQTKIKVGGQKYKTSISTIQYPKDVPISISIPLYNPDKNTKEMTVTYDLYDYDSVNPANKITSKTEKVTVQPKSEKILTYVLDKGIIPVYYLSITAQPTDQKKKESVFREKTISNIQFTIQDTSKPRLDFTGVNMYPLIKGTEATLVTCFNDTNKSKDEDISKIETVIVDNKGNELAKTIYDGKIYPEINAIVQKFSPKKNLSDFTVISTVYNSEKKVIDRVEKVYSCQDIDPDNCMLSKNNFNIISIFIILIIIGLFIFVFKKKLNNIKKNEK